MPREKPAEIPQDVWDLFNEHANEIGLGDHPDDWGPWFATWRNGWDSCQEYYA